MLLLGAYLTKQYGDTIGIFIFKYLSIRFSLFKFMQIIQVMIEIQNSKSIRVGFAEKLLKYKTINSTW